jgi:hypothetical protein
MRRSAIADLYGVDALRERVLAAWAASPARFREDANAEEDYALGGYRDRVVVELAQNAADAARRAGSPGRLRLVLADGVLTAANTGAPLDAAGVEALSTLRASAKRDDTGAAGRFGVGFAAVVAVSDEPAIWSAGAASGVTWSAARTRELVAAVPALAGELGRREGHVPLLRLPFAFPHPGVGEGFATVVRLPLRDPAAVASVRRQLAEAGPALLLALPDLAAVEISLDGAERELVAHHEPAKSTVTINGVEWLTVAEHGPVDPALLADRPTEERARTGWQVRWALSRAESVPGVLHAPTASDERIDLPALLIASFPLAPDRRHVAPGPLTDFLVERAAEAYLRLLRELPGTPRILELVPRELAASELDLRLRRAILARLPEAPLLPVLGGGLARGRDAVAVDGPREFLELLGEVLPGLLPAQWPVHDPALAALGVRRLPLADVVDLLGTLEREPAWWRRLYESLADVRDGLGALPVPLADGRTVRGPRGALLAADGLHAAALGALRLRFVHPEAAHPLLLRLGAVEAGARTVLGDPSVRAAVVESFDADDPEAIAEAVLGLVRAAGVDPGDEPWLADLALPDVAGELYPAGELLLPDSPLREVMADDAPFGVVSDDLVERWGAEPLLAVGVLHGFALVREEDVELGAAFDLEDEERWAAWVMARLGEPELPPFLPELVAVRDLELVADWAGALALLSEPPLRAAVVEPAHVVLHDGRRVAVPSYTAWWLRERPVLGGRRPADLRAAEAVELAGLYDPAPEGFDAELLRALGVRRSLAELLAEPGGAEELLDRLADPRREVDRETLRRVWRGLAGTAELARPPERVRALVDGVPEVVPAADAMVLDDPALLPLLTGQPLIVVGHPDAVGLAEALDLALAGEEIAGVVESAGETRPVPEVAVAVLGGDSPPAYVAHAELVVDGRTVSWWYDADTGMPHAADLPGLARALAWAADRWTDRHFLEAALREPESLPRLLAERDLEPS